MRPIILKLLNQEPVTQREWQDLFYSVHLVCLWDERGPAKLRDALKEDIMDFIKQAQQVIIRYIGAVGGGGFYFYVIIMFCFSEFCSLLFIKKFDIKLICF